MKELDTLEKIAKQLWQGKGCEISEVVETTDMILNIINQHVRVFEKRGIIFPMEYVRDAARNLNHAIEGRDDYALADCIFFEWREIGIVLDELIEGL